MNSSLIHTYSGDVLLRLGINFIERWISKQQRSFQITVKRSTAIRNRTTGNSQVCVSGASSRTRRFSSVFLHKHGGKIEFANNDDY